MSPFPVSAVPAYSDPGRPRNSPAPAEGRSGRRGELPGGRVPAPGGGGGETGAAEPAVDAQQRDAVGLPGEDPLAGRGEAERLAGERRPVAQRRRDAELRSVLGLDQPVPAVAET